MLDIAPTELLLVAFVALVVIGPKDLPKALRVLGYWVGKARNVARQFRSGFDDMVREAELAEMEKRWASENERIMREHPQVSETADTMPEDGGSAGPADVHSNAADMSDDPPVMQPILVEKPELSAAPEPASPPDQPGVDRIAS